MANKNEVLEALKQDKNLHLVQRVLRSMDIPSGTSWLMVEKNLDAAIKKDPKILDELISLIRTDVLVDKKAITYIALDKARLIKAVYAIKKVSTPSNSLVKFFPLNADSKTLKKDDGKLKVVHVYADADGCGVVLSRKREFSIREIFTRNQFMPAMQAQFPDYEKIIALKYHMAQTYDVIYVNTRRGLIELRADATLHGSKFQNNGQLGISTGDLLFFAKTVVFKTIGFDISKSIINFHPMIKKLYNSSTGRVKKLGFSTTTESIKHESVSGEDDLRSELFHSAGSAAIGNGIDPFEIIMDWKRQLAKKELSKPQLTIPGTYQNSVKANARSDYAILKNVRDENDLDFITDILMKMR